MNDRADVAAMLNAGLHLGQERSGALNRATGFEDRSHRLFDAQRRAASGRRWRACRLLGDRSGFATASKENPDPVLGADEFRRLRLLTGRPVVAIGGITRGNALGVTCGRRGFGGGDFGSVSGRWKHPRACGGVGFTARLMMNV